MSPCIYLLRLAVRSAWNRRGTLALIVFSIALSTTLLLSIERLRTQLRESFVQSVSGTDLIVGPRGSAMQLVLYAIFHVGSANNTLSLACGERLSQDPRVAWSIPVSLGDTHREFPVVATTEAFLKHFRYRGGERLVLVEGNWAFGPHDVVLGAEVARSLGYSLGARVILSHGESGGEAQHHHEHSQWPFQVSGILAPTGTPVDRSLYSSLESMELIHAPMLGAEAHVGHEPEHEHVHEPGHAHAVGHGSEHGHVHAEGHEPEHDHVHGGVTAYLLGLKKRSQALALQRELNEAPGEALTAVLPAVAMNQIWDMVNVGEKVLLLISVLVTVVGLVGLAAAILAGLGERRRELAILRSAGASPLDILLLMAFEGGLLVGSGVVAGLLALYGLLAVAAPVLAERFGVALSLRLPGSGEWLILAGICLAGMMASLIPAYRAYRLSLADGLTVSL